MIRKVKRGIGVFFIILSILIFLMNLLLLVHYSGITGLVTGETAYSEKLNLNFNESTEYSLELKEIPLSLRLSGYVIGNGTFKVYVKQNGKRYLVLDNAALEKYGAPLITGMAVDSLDKTLDETANNSIDLNEILIETIKSNGSLIKKESINKILDESINLDKILIKNEINKSPELNETQIINEIINKSIGLNESLIDNKTQNEINKSIGLNKTLIENKSINKILNERIKSNETRFIPIIKFENICIETCSLTNFSEDITLIVELDNAAINLTEIEYNIKLIESITKINVTNATKINVTINETKQYEAVIGKPVRWIKRIRLNETASNLTVKLPQNISNVKVREVIDGVKKESRKDKLKVRGAEEETELTIEESVKEVEVEYETGAPYAVEEDIERGKRITIIGPEAVHYENVLAFTDISGLNLKDPSRIRIKWVENDTYITPVSIQDRDNDGIYDYVEWIVHSLSNQTYELIIEISRAEHLDENRQFISDIYNETYQLDDIWSEPIPSEHYVRVAFQKELASGNDITLYLRVISGDPKIEVYEAGKDEVIAEFTSLDSNQYNKVFLTGLQGSQDTFDLKIVGGSIELDHIIDPSLVNADASITATGVTLFNISGGKNLIRLNSTRLVAFWEDDSNDASCANSTTGGATWGTYSSETGTHGDTAIATDGVGIVYVVTDEASNAYDLDWIYRTAPGCNIVAGTFADVNATNTNDNIRPDVAFDIINNRFVICSMDNDDWDIDYAYQTVGSTSPTWRSVTAVGGARTIDSCSIDVSDSGNVFIAADDSASSTLVVFNSSNSFATTTTVQAYAAAVRNMHMSMREKKILITAEDANSDLVVIYSEDGRTYQNATLTGTFQDPEGCIDANGNFHIAFEETTAMMYITYSQGSFFRRALIANITGALRVPSVRCTNFPLSNRLNNNDKLELVYTDVATNIYFANVTIDTKPPTYTNLANNGTGVKVNGYVNFSVRPADTIGLSNITFYWNNSGSWAKAGYASLSGLSAFYNKTLTVTATRGKYICGNFSIRDSYSYENKTAKTCFTVANTVPRIPTVTAPANGKNYSSVNITYNSTDADNDALSYRVYINAKLNRTTTKNISNWNASDGYYNLTVTANDSSSFSANSTVVRFRKDTIAPKWGGNKTNASPVYTNKVYQFNITINDSGSKGSFWIFSWNNTGTWNNNTNGTWRGAATRKIMANVTVTAAAGKRVFYRWYANDSADNWNKSEMRSFVVSSIADNTPPTYSNLNNNGTGIKVNGLVNFSVNMTDDGVLSNISFYWNNSGTWAFAGRAYLAGSSAFYNKTLIVTATRGKYVCGNFSIKDSSNNENKTTKTCFTVANTVPRTPTVTAPTNGKNYSSVNITYNSTDADNDALSYRVYINAKLNRTTTKNISNWNASDNYYNLTVTANDSSSFSANSTVVRFRKDTIAPKWGGNKTNASPVYTNKAYQFNITINDSGSKGSFWIFSWNNTGTWNNNTNGTWRGAATRKIMANVTVTAAVGKRVFYRWYANDSADNWNKSEMRSFVVGSANVAPSWYNNKTNITIIKINNSVRFNITANDTNGINYTIFSINLSAWKNETPVAWSGRAPVNLSTTKKINLTAGRYICWRYYANDSLGLRNVTRNYCFTVNNTGPGIVNLRTPTNNNGTILDRTPTFVWNASYDPDYGNTITYSLKVVRARCLGIFSCTVGGFNKTNISNRNFTNTTLNLDVDAVYNWSVRAYDGTSYSPWSSVWNFTVLSTSILIVNGTVQFGSMSIDQTKNTTKINQMPYPFIIENDGNVAVNVTIYAQNPLWIRQGLNTTYFRYMAGNYSRENGSIRWAKSAKNWTNVSGTTAGTAKLIFAYLNYTATNDTAEAEILVRVPADEPPGKKESTVVFTATYSGVG